MKLLDLYCGAGGAGVGYMRAGFDVVGVDINSSKSCPPFRVVIADALDVLSDRNFMVQFDAVHASPPCQAFTPLSALPHAGIKNPPVDLIEPTRKLLQAAGLPWIMENVIQAPLHNPVRLCGTMFGLRLYRHRNFESSFDLVEPVHPKHTSLCMRAGYLPTEERPFMSIHGRNGHNSKAWVSKAAEYMEMPWASTDLNGVCEAIPPAYTEFIGGQLLSVLSVKDLAA